MVDSLAQLTTGAEVNELDSRAFWIAQQNILGFKITVNYFEVWPRQKEEGGGDLLSEFPGEVERHPPEVCVPEEVVQVVGKELEDQAEVVPPDEVMFQLDHVVFVILVGGVHRLKKSNLKKTQNKMFRFSILTNFFRLKNSVL